MHIDNHDWHTLPPGEVARLLVADPQIGLSSAEAAKRLVRFGPNSLQEQRKRSTWRMLLDQFSDFMIIVLIGAAIISGVVGDVEDTVAIIVIVVLNAVIGFVQEYRAERAMEALKRMAEAGSNVLRDGRPELVNAS
jgi:Ca2+-transporting ATPase